MNPVKLCRLHSRVCRNCDAHNIFSSSDTSSIKPTQYEVVSFYSQLHSFFSLRFLPVVRLIECLQVNLAGQRAIFAVASPPRFLFSPSAWVWKINDINPCIAVGFHQFMNWSYTFIKTFSMCVCAARQSRWWRLTFWDGPYFSVFPARALCIE